MGRINGWRKKKGSVVANPYWEKGDEHIWVYANKTWDVSTKTGNVENYRTTHYTVQKYTDSSGKVAHSIGGKKFKNKKSAIKFAIRQLKRKK